MGSRRKPAKSNSTRTAKKLAGRRVSFFLVVSSIIGGVWWWLSQIPYRHVDLTATCNELSSDNPISFASSRINRIESYGLDLTIDGALSLTLDEENASGLVSNGTHYLTLEGIPAGVPPGLIIDVVDRSTPIVGASSGKSILQAVFGDDQTRSMKIKSPGMEAQFNAEKLAVSFDRFRFLHDLSRANGKLIAANFDEMVGAVLRAEPGYESELTLRMPVNTRVELSK
jgi:hypothetical protein